ncbi:hypothetical protein [Nonomuraea antri]|uniref:hypothetical protein n=1 Tax=Nonomuraea antri TaxID=2730852 RepID=UPI001C2B9734|nr:hypothetical protein [Nonomuraea antri]
MVTALTVSGSASPALALVVSSDTTQNGWPVVKDVPEHAIEGSNLSVRVLSGDVSLILLHVVRRFHYEIDTLRKDAPNEISGHLVGPPGGQPYESNYFSGTAIAIRPGTYSSGVAGGFFPHELIVIRDVLAECEGVVRWGGDERVPKESHFQIDVPPGDPRIGRLAARVGSWNRTPGKGAGAEDPFRPERIKAARQLELRQRTR